MFSMKILHKLMSLPGNPNLACLCIAVIFSQLDDNQLNGLPEALEELLELQQLRLR